MSTTDSIRVLVTGATGYVGGRLVSRLLGEGLRVRCLVREADRLLGRPWREQVEVVTGDLLEAASLAPALVGVDVAYYLVHSLGAGPELAERDFRAATHFAAAARQSAVKRIIYLSGLGEAGNGIDPSGQARPRTGDVLRTSGVAVTEFQAGPIIGSGSLALEMVRCLTERLPVMICPRWAFTRFQPIAIRNVLDYLVAALSVPASAGRVIEIGGGDAVTYRGLFASYAEIRGLRRWMLRLPLFAPQFSSYWVHLLTPVPANIVSALVDGLRTDTVVTSPAADQIFPHLRPMDHRAAIRRALEKLAAGEVETAWSDALWSSQHDRRPVSFRVQEGMIIETRHLAIAAPVAAIYDAFTGLGGMRGWLYMNWTWRVRGAIDRLLGGVGLRRGRRNPDSLRVGEALDFWRVEAFEPNRMLRLRAEMKVPGKAWLQFEVKADEQGPPVLFQTAFFAPKGVAGLAYWYVLYPIHAVLFTGMIRRIAERARALAGDRVTAAAAAGMGEQPSFPPVGRDGA